MSQGFDSFSTQHFSALLVFGVITYAAIRKGKISEEPLKTNIGLVLAGVTFSSLIIETMVLLSEGDFDILVDLPLYLCDIVAFMLPFILLTKNRKWIGILYFWAMAGTMQALLTPDLDHGFPSFYFFRYFITHAGIVAAILYTVIVLKIRMNWRDFYNAIIYAQFYIIGIHLVNSMLGSNYSYTMQKPPSATILDYFGPWPWYILLGEVLMVILFIVLLLPFLVKRKIGEPS